MSLVEFTEDNWDELVLGARVPIMVDVWAPWCVPCRKVTPMVRDLAEAFPDRLVVGTLNGDAAPSLISRYAVRSLPTVLLFDGGVEVARVSGVPKMDKLRAVIAPYMESN